MSDANPTLTLAERIYNIRLPSLLELFCGRLARWVRQLREWRKRGLLKKALAHKRRLALKPKFEALEPRLLLSADVSYAYDVADALHFNDGDALANKYILDIFDDAGTDKLRLRAEDLSVLQTGVLANDGVNKFSITGLGATGDQLTIDFSNIAGQIGADPRYDIEVVFDGGNLDGLDIFDDFITIEGDGSYELQSFKLTGLDDIIIDGSVHALGDIEIESKASSSGGLLGTDILANASSAIVMDGGTLSGQNISLTANSTVNVDGDNLVFISSVAIGGVLSDADAAVTVNGGVIDAEGNLAIAANSSVTTVVSRAPDTKAADGSAKSTSADAVIAISIVSSDATVTVANGTLAAGGTADVGASNSVNVTTTADGSAGANGGDAAGAVLGFTLVTGDTQAIVTGGTISADDVNLSAVATHVVSTTAVSTQDGAASSAGGTNQSEAKLKDPRGDGNGAGNDSDKAATTDGDVSFAAAVAVSVHTGKVEASVANAAITADDGDGLTTDDIKVKASATKTITTKADGSQTTEDATGVGIGVAISVVDTDTQAVLGGTTTSLTAGDVTLSALMPESKFIVEAKSGASSSGTAIAGSLAMNFVFVDTGVKVLAGSNIDLHGANLVLDSQATTIGDAKAYAAAGGDSKSGDTGVGISVAVSVHETDTVAALEGNVSFTDAKDVTLNAMGSHEVTTTAEGGGTAKDGTGVGGALAITVANNTTEATIGAAAAALDVTGAVSATADHHGSSTTTANADANGTSTAVGAALALGFVNDTARASTARSITADGAVSFTARADGSSKSEAKASAAGADKTKESGKGNSTADDQSGKATNLAKNKSGDNSLSVDKKASTDDGDAGSGGDGSVGVGAALALNIASSVADASISGVTIIAGEGSGTGALNLKSENNMDASAIADASAALGGAGKALTFDGASGVDDGAAESITLSGGHGLATGDKVVYNKGDNANKAIGGLTEGGNYFVNVSGNTIKLYDTKANADAGAADGLVDLTDGSGTDHNLKKLSTASGTAVGVGIALNIADMQNHADVGAGTTVTADGVSAQALMKDVGGDQTHKFAAKATSGASGGDTGVAGSFALNYSKANAGAVIAGTANVTAGTGDVTISAASATDAQVEAKAKTGEAGDTGVGVSVGINIAVDNDTRSVIEDGAILTGGDDISLTATGSHVVNTTAKGGGQSTGATGVGGALALTVADNQTEAGIGTGTGLDVTGKVEATANHHGASVTSAQGDGTGSSTAVGVALALGFVDDSAIATTNRNITADGAVSFTASADGSSKSEATASAEGADKAKEGDKGKTKADDQSKSAAGLASKQSGETKKADGKKASTDDGDAGTSGDGSVGVGAALALNIASSVADASISGVTIIAGDGVGTGALNLKSENNMDASAIADASAAQGKTGTAVGIGIALNIAEMQNRASVGAGTTVIADGVSAQALMKDVGGDKTHKFAAKANSGASGGDTGVAGSFALNYSKAQTDAGLATAIPVLAGTGDVTISAESSTEALVEAKAKAGKAGETGVGVSVGINIAVDNDTRAAVADGTTLTGGDDVTLTATGSHVVNTTAEGGGGAKDGTGVGGALALTVADNRTEARIGTGSKLDVTGALDATANHHGASVTMAKGDGTGTSTAVGVALALGFVDDSATATSDRNITADKAVSFTASVDGASKSEAIASAAGGDKAKEGDKGKTKADDQSKSAAGLASKQSGETKKADGKKASTEDGNGGGSTVSVGAALALNIANSVADASLDNITIIAGEGAGTGALNLKSENNMDASAIADASAALGGAGKALTFDGASGVDDGAAESITLSGGHGLATGDKVVYNKGDSANKAIGGLTEGGNYFVNVSSNTIKLYDTKAHAEAGAAEGLVDLTDGSGTDHNLKKLSTSSGTAVGIGIAINIAGMQNHANVGAGMTVTADGVSAQALMKDVDGDKAHKFAAKATSGASGGDTGVAGSFALNYSQANAGAVIASTANINAGTGDVTIAAANTTNAQVEAKAKAGKAGDTGVGVSVGINIAVDNDTRAVIEDGAILTGGG